MTHDGAQRKLEGWTVAGFVLLAALLGLVGLALLTGEAWGQSVSIRPDAQSGTQTNVACTASSSTALAANTRRRDSLFIAPMANTDVINLCPTATCTVASGIPLSAGGSIRDNSYIGPWSCISTSGAQNVRVTETAR